MSRVINALIWDGVYTQILIYSIMHIENLNKALNFNYQDIIPIKTPPPFYLVDDQGSIKNKKVILYEVLLEKTPQKLYDYLAFCLSRTLSIGSFASWLSFDGVFSFEHFFTDDVANQIYGIQFNGEKPMIALFDEELNSEGWLKVVREARKKIANK